MSIVPWKGAEPPGGPDRPMGSLVEELLAPLDRDEFRREITYYRDLTSHSSPPAAAPGAKRTMNTFDMISISSNRVGSSSTRSPPCS